MALAEGDDDGTFGEGSSGAGLSADGPVEDFKLSPWVCLFGGFAGVRQS